MDVIDELIAHCEAWEPWARVMGNVCAGDAAQALRSLRAELAEAKKLKDGMLDVLGGACPKDHSATPFDDFKGCTPCLRAELAEARRDAERYRWLRSDDCPFSCYEQEGPDNWGWCPTSSRDLDEAIDAAMAGGENG